MTSTPSRACRALLYALLLGLPGMAAAQILVGSVVARTGPAAVSGDEFLKGSRACFDAVNARGGVQGQRIELVTGDDGGPSGSDPARTVAEFNRLHQASRPVAFVNASGTPNMEALLRDGSVVRAGIPVIGPFSLSNELRTRGVPQMFFVRTGSREEAGRMVRQAATMSITRLGLVYVDTGFGKEFNALIQEHLADQQGIASESYLLHPNAPDIDAAVTGLLRQQAQMVLLLVPGRMVPDFVRKYRSAGGGAFIMTTSAASADHLARTVGPAIARGVGVMQVVPSVHRMDLPIVRDFHAAMTATFKTWVPTAYALEGYINARILVEGLRRARPGATPADLTTALRSIRNLDIGGLVVDLSDPRRSGLRFVEIGVIGPDGRLKM
jgi:branched-chain amino acid transport system substrate-binding protein